MVPGKWCDPASAQADVKCGMGLANLFLENASHTRLDPKVIVWAVDSEAYMIYIVASEVFLYFDH